jgi:hypothetical protein
LLHLDDAWRDSVLSPVDLVLLLPLAADEQAVLVVAAVGDVDGDFFCWDLADAKGLLRNVYRL